MAKAKKEGTGYDPFLVTFRVGGIYHSVADEEAQIVVLQKGDCDMDVRGTVEGRYPLERYTDRNGKSSEFIVDRNKDTRRVRYSFYALDFVRMAEGMPHGKRIKSIYEMIEDGERR